MGERDLIAVRMPTGPTMVEALERIWDDGDAVLPIDPALPAPAVERLLQTLRPGALVQPRTGDRPGASLRRLPSSQPVPSGTALVVPTSGTTGEPKGVELTHAAVRVSVQASISRLGCESGDKWLLCLPLHHVAGLLVLLRSHALDSDPVVLRGFDVDGIAADTQASWISLVPTQLVQLLDAGIDLSRFEAVLLGGGRIDDVLVARAEEAGTRVVTSYGMTETCGGCVYDGWPLDGVEIDITPDSRIAIRGPVLMRGYRGRPDLTGRVFHEGWFVAPDRGRVTEDGRLEVLGRVDDIIVTGGENVSPHSVEAALARHPGVADVAVLGRPDERWGEIVTALVVPGDPDAPPSLEELREHARATLPPHALPREVWTVPSLPRDAMGKVSQSTLERLRDSAAR